METMTRRFNRVGLMAITLLCLVSGSHPTMAQTPAITKPKPRPMAVTAGSETLTTSHIVIGRHRYRLTRDVVYTTRHFGQVVLGKGFESDGSTSPIPDVPGSLYAGFLHDALYRGAPQLLFLNGYPGPWTKLQADQEYCFQLKRLGVKREHRNFNCTAPKLLIPPLSPWEFRKALRERYWAAQSRAKRRR